MTSSSTRLTRFATAILASAAFVGVLPFSSISLPAASAQTLTTGSLSGSVLDPSGAVVPGATVILTDKQGGTKQQVKTDASGRFAFPLLRPSNYTVEVNASGLSAAAQTVAVQVGSSPNLELKVTPSGASQSVTVSAQAIPLTDTQSPSLITTFSEQQVQNLPAPGGDITTVAFTAPGVVINTGSGYGNFSVDGLPGTSNLYVINGFDEEDPFLNLNNSGSSNLTLGQAEIAEASVVVNGYSAQYGRQAGAIVEYTTKSGSDQLHGQANYYYNGDALNANDWFRNNAGEGRERAVSNEWAANAGGPIIKDKLFFFGDYEGLRYVLPNAGQAVFPSPQFQAYTLANVPAANVPYYQQAFGLYNSSPNYAIATPVTTGNGTLQDSTGALGCGSFAGTPTGTGGTFGVDTPCELAAEGNASNTNKEYLITARVDWNVSDRHRIFGRFKLDRGTQPTATSFVAPVFNETSTQPSYEGQFNDSYVITPHLSNQFVFAANWYTAYFGPANLAATIAAFPNYLTFDDGAINSGADLGTIGMANAFPQGRNVSQYQFVDDVSWVKGNHTIQFGYDFRRADISDYDAQSNSYGTYSFAALGDFASGNITNTASSYSQAFPTEKTAYLAIYNLGAYLQDNWQANSRLHLTYGIRFDRNGNPLCNNDCFARYNGDFPAGNAAETLPYGQSLLANQPDGFNGVESVVAQGRVGFNYALTSDGHTVIRGGVGLFADTPPAIFMDAFIQNFPQLYSATVQTGNVGASTTAGTAANNGVLSNAAIQNGFASNLSPAAISAAVTAQGGVFTPPNLALAPNSFRNPKYLEFNLQFQKQFTASDALIIGYVGNTGYDEFITNPLVNGAVSTGYNGGSGFAGLPTYAAPDAAGFVPSPDPRFAGVTSYLNEGNSNYNALQVTYKHQDRHGFDVAVNYTYSHSLDDASNGGQSGEPFGAASVTTVVDAYSVSALNYSNSDYDVRHSINGDYSYQMPFIKKYGKLVNSVAGGWLFAGKSYWRTGNPFSIVDGNLAAAAGNGTLGGTLLATLAPGANPSHTCTGNVAVTPCLSTADFLPTETETTFGNIRRNSFFGPHYADSDFALSKKFVDTQRYNVQIGTYAFNVFNHPNFATPANDIAGGNIGQSSSIVAPPTSPYGSFSGAGIGGRVLQVFGKVTF